MGIFISNINKNVCKCINVHSDRTKAKERAYIFFDVCRLFFDLFLLSLSLLLPLVVNGPLGFKIFSLISTFYSSSDFI